MATRLAEQPDLESEVRDLYERLPYPRPETDLDAFRDCRRTLDGSPRHFFHLYWPHAPYRADLDVLVAGCGTSQAAKIAIQNPAATVTGIDVSTASLDHTRKLAERYGLGNLSIHHHPIERVGDLGRAFDLVICTGVLHHLPDPDAGLRALRGVLRAGGAMHLMVYARYGRTGVSMMQEYCRRLGIEPREGGPEELLALVRSLPEGHPLEAFARQADDLTYEAGIADALLHPCDRSYTVPDVYAWLERCGVQHARWFLQAPYSPQCGFLAGSPHAERLLAEPAPERHAAMELLRGAMITHTFIAVRDDRDPASFEIGFGGEAWLDLVPSIFPGSTVLPGVPPPGMAGRLKNRAHAFPDLETPLPAAAARLHDAIDGRRTIGEIAAAAGLDAERGDVVTLSRALFRALWLGDHVILRS